MTRYIPPRVKPKNGQQALLTEIFDSLGGAGDLAEVTGHHRQCFSDWSRKLKRGVPIKYIKDLAEALGVPKYGLNYSAAKAFWDDCPPWKKIIGMYDLTRAQKLRVLKFEEPE